MTRHKRSTPNRGFRVADKIQRDLAELVRELKDLHFQFDCTTERAADLSALIAKANAQRARDD